MTKIIKFIRRDFSSVSEAMNYLCKRELPKGILILYYIVAGSVTLLVSPFLAIWYYWYKRKNNKMFKEWDEA